MIIQTPLIMIELRTDDVTFYRKLLKAITDKQCPDWVRIDPCSEGSLKVFTAFWKPEDAPDMIAWAESVGVR